MFTQSVDVSFSFLTGINMSGDIGNKPIMPPTTVLDTAQIKIFYELNFKQDSLKTATTNAQTILLCGRKYLMFTYYYDILKDSLYMDAEKKHMNGMSIMGKAFTLMDNTKYPVLVIANLIQGTTIIREKSGVNYYQYEDSIPALRWQLENADSAIPGYNCGRATCHYKGRDYVAWYAKDISISLGSYVFGRLPGLIMKLYDSHNDYVFTLNGLEPTPQTFNLSLLNKSSISCYGSEKKDS